MVSVNTVESLFSKTQKYVSACNKANGTKFSSILQTKPQSFKGINTAELKLANSFNGDSIALSTKKVKLNDENFEWLYWRNRRGALPAVSKPIDYSDEAKSITEKFIDKNIVKDRIPDGFRMRASHQDCGFNAKGEPILDFDFLENGALGETIYVDRRTDKGLNTTIRKFKELIETNKNLSEENQVDLLMQFVNGCYKNSRNHWTDSFPLDTIALGQTVKQGAGMCRHRALLTKVLADEAGLSTSLVRGCYKTGNSKLGNHMWNEFTNSNGEKYVLDAILGNFKKVSSKDPELGNYTATSNSLFKKLYAG